MILPKLPKVSATGVTRAALHEMAPVLLKGMLKDYLSDKDPQDAYNFMMDNDLWELVPQGRRQYLINAAPWGLDWFTIDWLYKNLQEINPGLAVLLVTSPGLREKAEQQLSKIRTILK